ncbi:putative phosphosugar-binding protein [Kribbella amoyensis]|uniref:Putative phosphosugar-binding protein n=1 Tax=Kribbella amoyensis TaxID=996641 RepID=A0A561BKA5_9ACTN|nr:sugar isomerase domain-containing protein [Kribbella amoyensis]TWD79291.1 putative phosphosugar-binding protein [Kribbella amoyensis]
MTEKLEPDPGGDPVQASLQYPAVARDAIEQVLSTQLDPIETAARMIVDAYGQDGILQVFGTGHSRAVCLELSGRAGGLASVSMLAVKDLVMFGGTDPAQILDPTYEREPGLARRIYDLARPSPRDAFLIVSNSGINASVVEMAELARDRGHPLIAITSLRHTSSVDVRAGGRRLSELADVIIDNGAPAGDATIDLRPGVRIGAISSLTGVLIAQLLTESVCRLLAASGAPVPVLVSANLPVGDSHNEPVVARFAERVRPIEP